MKKYKKYMWIFQYPRSKCGLNSVFYNPNNSKKHIEWKEWKKRTKSEAVYKTKQRYINTSKKTNLNDKKKDGLRRYEKYFGKSSRKTKWSRQFVCHQDKLLSRYLKESWNIEPDRKNVSYKNVKKANCNP